MDPKRQRQTLGVLLVVLIAVGAWQWLGGAPDQSIATTPAGTPRLAGQGSGLHVPPVNLDALHQERPEPTSSDRNPFQFGARRGVPAGGRGTTPAAPPPVVPAIPTTPPPPPPPPPIPLRFLGLVKGAPSGSIAILTDGRDVYQAREGETIAGQYRLVKISADSVELSYLDGRGRQMIRLSGG